MREPPCGELVHDTATLRSLATRKCINTRLKAVIESS